MIPFHWPEDAPSLWPFTPSMSPPLLLHAIRFPTKIQLGISAPIFGIRFRVHMHGLVEHMVSHRSARGCLLALTEEPFAIDIMGGECSE